MSGTDEGIPIAIAYLAMFAHYYIRSHPESIVGKALHEKLPMRIGIAVIVLLLASLNLFSGIGWFSDRFATGFAPASWVLLCVTLSFSALLFLLPFAYGLLESYGMIRRVFTEERAKRTPGTP